MADVLRPDQPPVPNVDELTAIRAVFKGTASKAQQLQFTTYLLKMCGIAQSEYGQGEFWAFMGGKRWVATQLMAMAEVMIVTASARTIMENENG